MNPLILAQLVRFGPWLLMLAGLAVGGFGLKSCAGGLEERGRLAQEVAGLQTQLAAERDCEVTSACAARTVGEALAAERALAERITEIRADNEQRVAAAVARYARSETVTRLELEKARNDLEQQKADVPACAAWASSRVACIVRPLGPGRFETGDR